MTDIVLGDEIWKDVEPGTEALMDRWLVKEGDKVQAGQTVAQIVLVKTTVDVPAPVAGVVEKILVPAERTFARGRPLATMRAA
jgi:pyruvate/2-oxoglutarate dehydrogenase complex dihydrolipoamide acyltransferase (E2) component